MSKFDPFFKPVKIVTLTTYLQVILFVLFFNFSKHNLILAQLNPFIEDPFDAVGSFGIQLAAVAGGLSLLRIFRPYPRGITLKNLTLILNCNLTALLAILVTLIADSVALVRFFPKWIDLSAGLLLAAITCGLLAVNTILLQRILSIGWELKWFTSLRNWPRTLACGLAGMIILASYLPAWRRGIAGGIIAAVLGLVIFFVITALSARMIFADVRPPYEDIFDDLDACYQWIKQHTSALKSFYRRLERFLNRRKVQNLIQSLNPRKHPWRLIVLLAFAGALTLLLNEFQSEGLPQKNKFLWVFSVYTGIETLGVLLGYKLFRKFLGIFQT
jgi:hypothetical protein